MPGDIGFLESIVAEQRRRDLPGDGDDRDRVHVGRGDAGDKVQPRAGSGKAYAYATACPRIAIRGMRGCLFVPYQDVPNGES